MIRYSYSTVDHEARMHCNFSHRCRSMILTGIYYRWKALRLTRMSVSQDNAIILSKKKNVWPRQIALSLNLTTTSTVHLLTNNIGLLSALGKYFWRYSLLNLIQLIDPLFQTLRQNPNLLPGQHPRLHPRDIRVLVDLVDRA